MHHVKDKKIKTNANNWPGALINWLLFAKKFLYLFTLANMVYLSFVDIRSCLKMHALRGQLTLHLSCYSTNGINLFYLKLNLIYHNPLEYCK